MTQVSFQKCLNEVIFKSSEPGRVNESLPGAEPIAVEGVGFSLVNGNAAESHVIAE